MRERNDAHDRIGDPVLHRTGCSADASARLAGKRDPQFGALPGEKLVRHLHNEAGAVARVVFATAGPAVLQIDENLHGVGEQLVRFLAADVDDEADAARVVLVPRIVQTLGLRRQIAIVSPAWLSPSCSNSTMPASERVRLTRFEITIVLARIVSLP